MADPTRRPAPITPLPVPGAGAIAPHPGTEGPIRVLILAAYPAVRTGLTALIAQDPALRPVEPAPTARAARTTPPPLEPRTVAGDEPDVVLADVAALGGRRADDVAEAYPGVPLVLLGADPLTDGPGLAAGPVAYLGPDADGPTLVAAVHGVAVGLTVVDPALGVAAFARPAAPHPEIGSGEALTAREREVLRLVADGLPNKAIARELGISEHTAKFHVGSLLAKLGAGSRTEAVTLATRRGLLAI